MFDFRTKSNKTNNQQRNYFSVFFFPLNIDINYNDNLTGIIMYISCKNFIICI